MAITAEDVWLERVIPITDGFAVEEVVLDSDLHVIGSDVTVQISSAGDRLTVQLPFGSHTRTFLQEVGRCSPGRSSTVRMWRCLRLRRCVCPALASPARARSALWRVAIPHRRQLGSDRPRSGGQRRLLRAAGGGGSAGP
ncbi:type II inositol 1,4,5-trisphosphate 5-phosphatase-like, partial [Cyanistes caeruleus]|uniref:type II inositol 1,4,5-trisphosphate 5-phosphatase-like n=1 Tax=Cyanistes caeruleus TaxID=156563 RepID=UPI000CDA8397